MFRPIIALACTIVISGAAVARGNPDDRKSSMEPAGIAPCASDEHARTHAVQRRSDRLGLVPQAIAATKPRTDAIVRGYIDVSTGRYHKINPTSTRQPACVLAFDNLTWPDSLEPPNLGMNYQWLDPNGRLLCAFDDPLHPATSLYIHPWSSEGCGDPNDHGMPTPISVGESDNLDIMFDNYVVDPAVWGDPNTTRPVCQIDVLVGRDDRVEAIPRGEETIGVIVGFFEWSDRNGDGFLGGVSASPWIWIVTLPGAGIYDLSFPTSGTGLAPYGRDMILLDIADYAFDPNSGAQLSEEACGYFAPIAGGLTSVGTDVFDPNGWCPTINERVNVGATEHPAFDIGFGFSDIWVWKNGLADPNGALIDPNTNGVPGLQYEDTWAAGLGVVYSYETNGGSALNPSVMFQLYVGEEDDNNAPIADAGEDDSVVDADRDGTEQVSLDGSLSFDWDGMIVNYRWTEGANVLADGPAATPVVPLGVGTHDITLTVTDDDGATDTDTVVHRVKSPPTAIATFPELVECRSLVTLDGSASFDVDGTIELYEWLEGTTVLASDADPIATHLFQGDDGSTLGTHHLTLRVTDNDMLVGTVDFDIEVVEATNPCPPPPVGCDCGEPEPDVCDPYGPSFVSAVITAVRDEPNQVLVEVDGEFESPEVGKCYPQGTTIATGGDEVDFQVCGRYFGWPIADSTITVRKTSETTLDFMLVEPDTQSVVTRMKLKTGEVRVNITDCRPDYSTDFKVSSPNATTTVRGTDFLVSVGCLPYDSIALIDDGIVDIDPEPNDPNNVIYSIGQHERARVYPGGAVVIETTPALLIAAPEIDFGDVMVGQTLTLSPTIANTTANPITVNGYTVDGVPDPRTSFVIPPQDVDSIDVSFSPTALGAYVGSLEISYDSSLLTVNLYGNGTATPLPNCNVPSALCVPGCGDALGDADLNNDCHVNLTDLGLLLSAYGLNAGGDTDGDGDTDLTDLGRLLSLYDVSCP